MRRFLAFFKKRIEKINILFFLFLNYLIYFCTKSNGNLFISKLKLLCNLSFAFDSLIFAREPANINKKSH